jgi:hypothetical protein
VITIRKYKGKVNDLRPKTVDAGERVIYIWDNYNIKNSNEMSREYVNGRNI